MTFLPLLPGNLHDPERLEGCGGLARETRENITEIPLKLRRNRPYFLNIQLVKLCVFGVAAAQYNFFRNAAWTPMFTPTRFSGVGPEGN
ncbi:MAG: hypothetical protein WCI56_09480 [Hyphomicrobiales bacterium]